MSTVVKLPEIDKDLLLKFIRYVSKNTYNPKYKIYLVEEIVKVKHTHEGLHVFLDSVDYGQRDLVYPQHAFYFYQVGDMEGVLHKFKVLRK